MAIGRALVLSIVLVAAGITSGCYRGARIEVTELSEGQVDIEVLPTVLLSNRLCVGAIAIHEGSAGGAVVWAVRKKDDGHECRSQFTFPEVPPGYEPDGQHGLPGPLRAGEDYWIQVSGPGGLFNGRYFATRDS